MISVSSVEVDLYLEKIEEVIAVLNSIDYSIDPYDPSQDSEKTPHTKHSIFSAECFFWEVLFCASLNICVTKNENPGLDNINYF